MDFYKTGAPSRKKGKSRRASALADFLLCPALLLLFVLFFTAVRFAGKDPTRLLGVFSMLALLFSGVCASSILTVRHREEDSPFRRVILPEAATALVLFALALIRNRGGIPLSVPLGLCSYLLLALPCYIFWKKRPKAKKHYPFS